MSIFPWKKILSAGLRDEMQKQKLEDSQAFLIDAASAITDVAAAITDRLRNKLDLSNIVPVSRDNLIVCDPHGLIQHLNEEAITTFGAIVSTNIRDLICDTAIADVLLSGCEVPAQIEVKATRPEMQSIKVDQLRWIDGSQSFVLLMSKSDAGRSSLTSIAFDGMLVSRRDQIIAVNDSIETIFGYEAKGILGMSLRALFPNEHHAKLNEDTAQDLVFGAHDDGSSISFIFASSALAATGHPARLITVKCLSDDTTPSALAPEQSVARMIVCIGPSGNVVFANSIFARVYGADRKSILSRNIEDVLGDAELESFHSVMSCLTASAPTVRAHIKCVRDDYPDAIHDWTWHATFNDAGDPVEYLCSGIDISDVVSQLQTPGYF